MIDIESEVFDRVAKAVLKNHPKAYLTSEFTVAPAQFPCVSLEESDNETYRKTRDSTMTENHASVMYTLRVYSNLKRGRKSQCRKIVALADAEMLRMGFTRRTLVPVPNLNDPSIYQMVGRYTAIVSKDKVIYRR